MAMTYYILLREKLVWFLFTTTVLFPVFGKLGFYMGCNVAIVWPLTAFGLWA